MGRKVIFRGEPGTYSHLAAASFFDEPAIGTVDEYLAAIQQLRGDDRAIFPIENTELGTFARVADLFREHQPWIVGEVVVPFEHSVIGDPGTTFDEIERVVSRREVIDHCRGFIRDHDLDWKLASNTGEAVRVARDEHGPETAAIAAPLAAKLYDVELIRQGVQDNDDVMSRFFVVSRYRRDVPDAADKTTIQFVTQHKPGELSQALGVLEDHAINIERLDCRPIPDRPWHYAFHADVDGSIADPTLDRALHQLGRRALEVVVFGSYPRADAPSKDAVLRQQDIAPPA